MSSSPTSNINYYPDINLSIDSPVIRVSLPENPDIAAMAIIGGYLNGVHTRGITRYAVGFTAIEEEFPEYFNSEAYFSILVPFSGVLCKCKAIDMA